ncbi:fimbria/pilus outer membrane usher protein [Pseudomonas rhizosphaerae]|uniref:fimbria/pilus outer membrane usher protein n=1 Tax=Pseudomonas rhizosphaerae TaxID=216142 RepID=UPI000693F162|nr:fimbria/pilus outer membrane usher protein [Pseudomonas rhizosphaerae]
MPNYLPKRCAAWPWPWPTVLAGCLLCASPDACAAESDEVFDRSFLRTFGASDPEQVIDLNHLRGQEGLPPGMYPVTVRLNGKRLEQQTLRFFRAPGEDRLQACFTPALLDGWGVALAPGQSEPCVSLGEHFEGAAQQFDPRAMTLELSIPQAFLHSSTDGFIDEQEWDSGIDAALLNYQASAAQVHREGEGSHYQGSLYLQAGVNLAGWRLRSSSAFIKSPNTVSQWQRNNTYAQRDLPRQWGTLTAGEHFTPGNVFDSLPYRGVSLASDMSMLPDALQGYAPVVRGLAQTQAKVEVRQNGYSLYTTYVPPGPFVIDNLNAAGGSGELEVIVTEADGREQRFVQPYATLSNMLRPGIWRHSITVGEYNTGADSSTPGFTEATLAYGLPLDMTAYGGIQASSFYRAVQGGLGKSLGSLGALSLDVTQAWTDNPGQARDQGKSYGWRYGKSFATGTSLRFAGYRYSTEGYRDFSEAVWQQSPTERFLGSKRNRIEVSLAQATAQGSLYLGVFQQTYWRGRDTEQRVQLGLNTYWRGISYGLYANRNLGSDSAGQHQLSLTVSMPLGGSSSATYSASASQGALGHRASVAGGLDRANDWRYGVDISHSEQGSQSGAASLNYRSAKLMTGAAFAAGDGYRQATVSASGSVLAHPDGLAFGQPLGETIALIDASGVANVGVQNSPGARTNADGYAIVPYLSPYRRNRVALDTEHLGMEVDIDNGVLQSVPRRGAVVRARFEVSRTRKIIAVLRLANGKQPPFGSQVFDRENQSVGVVGPGGQVLLAVDESARELVAKWNERADGQCIIDLAPPAHAETSPQAVRTLVCQPAAEMADVGPVPQSLSQRVPS